MKKIKNEVFVEDNEHYHDTWKLLKNYRDVVWSLELSVHRVKRTFKLEYGSTIEEFLDSIYLAGADLSGSEIEQQAKCIEHNHQMLALIDNAVDLMRKKHKNGEVYYLVLYHTYLSPQQPYSVEDIIDLIASGGYRLSRSSYYDYRKDAVKTLSLVLWGYSAKECLEAFDSK